MKATVYHITKGDFDAHRGEGMSPEDAHLGTYQYGYKNAIQMIKLKRRVNFLMLAVFLLSANSVLWAVVERFSG